MRKAWTNTSNVSTNASHVTHHIDSENMWNVDEKGIMMGRDGKKNELVISGIRVKAPQQIQQGSREWVALIECISATGKDYLLSISMQERHSIERLSFCVWESKKERDNSS
jgi:hypothetical protein